MPKIISGVLAGQWVSVLSVDGDNVCVAADVFGRRTEFTVARADVLGLEADPEQECAQRIADDQASSPW